MEITLVVEPGRILEEARRSLFLWAIEEYEGDELRVSYALGINIQTLRANCAKYLFTHMLISRKQGSPIDYSKHAAILKMSAEGLSIKRIADHMHVTPQAVHSMLKRIIDVKFKEEKLTQNVSELNNEGENENG